MGQGLLCLSHCVPFGFSVASFLFKNFFKLKCSWHTLVSIVQYSDSTFIYNMLTTINIVNTYHCTNLLQYFVIMYYIYSLCCTLHPHDLFDKWKFVALYPLTLFSPSPTAPPLWQPLVVFCVFMRLFQYWLFLLLFLRFHI